MKKFLATMVVCFVAMALMTGCGSSNTPSAVAEKAYSCLKKKDFKGFAKLVNVSEEERNEIASFMNEKATAALDAQGGIKDFSIDGEEVDEEGGTAKVNVHLIYGNGTEEDATMNLEKNEDGVWCVANSL